MTRTEIEEKVKAFLIDDLEIDEDKVFPDAKLRKIWVLTALTLWTSW